MEKATIENLAITIRTSRESDRRKTEDGEEWRIKSSREQNHPPKPNLTGKWRCLPQAFKDVLKLERVVILIGNVGIGNFYFNE